MLKIDKDLISTLIIGLAIAAIIIAPIVYFGNKQNEKIAKECEARGGKSLSIKGTFLCVDPKILR